MQIVTPEMLEPSHPRRVVVVGSGYAGITTVVSLAHKSKKADGLEIVLVAPLPYQEALSELDLVAAGNPRPQWAELWHGDIFKGLDIKVVYDRLDHVVPNENRIVLGPSGTPTGSIPYWRLVIATGAIPSVPPIPGLREHGITMWSVRDAHRVQEAIERQFKQAATLCSAEDCRERMSVCVVGGGATGIEVIGTIADVWPRMAAKLGYPDLRPTLTVLDGRPQILYDLNPREREKAVRKLKQLGVDLVLGEKLAQVEETRVITETGRVIPAAITIWCGGAKADPDAVTWGFTTDNSGRLTVDDRHRIPSHPAIYAVGDVAAFRDPKENHVIPMLAQFAIQGGDHVGKTIVWEARGKDAGPFTPHMHGEYVSIGPRWGVGWMLGIPVSGWFAIVMKRMTYIIWWFISGSFRIAWRRTVQMVRMHRY